MYQYTEFDRQFVHARAAQYRDQLTRYLNGQLDADAFRPLRLQNGWYVQRYAPMLRVAVPYGELNSAQLRVLARIAREYDTPDPAVLHHAQVTQDQIALGQTPSSPAVPPDSDAGQAETQRHPAMRSQLKTNLGHFTTRQNVQFNWIALEKSADVMDLLASVNLHGIQTSGNCIRNITCDERAGVAPDEEVDPRPYAEILRQWSTLHPEFAYLPRKFKIAITGAREDRAALQWHDVGLRVKRNGAGEVGFEVYVGGGMGRTPMVASVMHNFVPWQHILHYLEAIVRVYNAWGRRDNLYKARIKILVKAEGTRFRDEVEAEYQRILDDGAHHTLAQAELDRIAACFVAPQRPPCSNTDAEARIARILKAAAEDDVEFGRWLHHNVAAHQHPELRVVTLSFKRMGYAPGDASADQLDAAAELAERYSAGEARVTHSQNLVLPWVRCDQLPELWRDARRLGLARPHIGLLTDLIACPGGDYCALANARSLPIAQAITERFEALDELDDLGPIDLHISGCINSCGHHHSGHIGVLGVDKDGQEWYQVTLGGSDGRNASGPTRAGKVVGPAFAAAEVVDVIEAVLDVYKAHRHPQEMFIDTLHRLGHEPFKEAANQARPVTRRPALGADTATV